MKYSPESYAKAFLDALSRMDKKDEGKLIKKFISVLAKNGDLGNFEKISIAIKKIITKRGNGKFIDLELARPMNKKLMDATLKNFSDKDHVEIKYRPDLLAGCRILMDGERELDYSFKRRLKNLFS
ncbi:F0F1 ATP synthase subunit delta [Candidatus Giovannonibacteria bacterium]|nr:F0F1 ATP synthase subunit delta [Candidatus Giovannonibacteria bacterium]